MPRGRAKSAEHYAEAFADYLIERRDSDGEVKWLAYCPAHETPGKSRPSAEICFNDGDGNMMWYCHVCAPTGADAHLDVLERLMKEREGATVTDLRTRKRIATSDAVKPSPAKPKAEQPPIEIDQFCTALISSPARLADLAEWRGVSEASVAQHDIGWSERRKAYMIPVRNAEGEVINVRVVYRNPNPERGKVAWMRKAGDHPMLFVDLLTDDVDDVLVVEGEWDAILARQLGFHAVTGTRGAKKWSLDDTAALGHRNVTILMDNDKAGADGANRILQSVRKARLAKSVRVVNHEVNGADFSDMVLKHGWEAGDFRSLIESVAPTPMGAVASLSTSGRPIPFRLLDSRNSANDVVESTVMVNARVGLSKLPWRGAAYCAGDAGKKCLTCPLYLRDLKMPFDLDREDRDQYLPMIGVPDAKVQEHMQRVLDLNCRKFEVDRAKDIDVEHLFVTAPVIEEGDGDDRSTGKMVTVYLVGSHDTEAGDVLKIVGKCESDPKRQDSVFMAWHKSDNDPLRERRTLSDADAAALAPLRPGDDETVTARCLSIVRSINGQYGMLNRDELGLAYLLIYASVLEFEFKGRKEHGWLQAMVLGDTRTGKTALADRYLAHFGLGSMIKCDVTTRAGLVGGQGTHNGNSFLKMGLLPRSDARLAFLDETTNILSNGEIMKHLTDMRSSGKMSINLIDSGQFRARVRQVWISNPPRDAVVDDFPHGAIQAINELIGSPQDLSRFDFLYAVKADRDTAKMINVSAPRRKRSPYTTAMMKMLFEWVWTRKADDIVISEPVEKEIGLVADRIGRRYENDRYRVIPGTDAGNKIARIAVAFAALTFSTDNNVRVIVSKEHVNAAEEFLEMMFDDDVLGLGSYCRREAMEAEEADVELAWLERRMRKDREYLNTAIWLSTQTGRFRARTMIEGLGMLGVMNADPVTSSLLARGLLVYHGESLAVSRPLRDFLRKADVETMLRRRRAPAGAAD